MTERDPLWLYLHFPLLPLESQQLTPGVAALLDERGKRLELCSREAVQSGLEPGMAIATACSICPDVELLSPDTSRLQQQLESLALWAGSFSAQVSVKPPQGLLLEVASMLHYFGGLAAMWRLMDIRLQRLGFRVHHATGHTPLASRILARAGRRICIEGEASHLQVLQSMPVTQLEFSKKHQDQLRGMGLTQLSQLLTLPRDAVSQRFGPKMLLYLDQLVGRQPDPQPVFEPPPVFHQLHEFSREVENSLTLLFPLRRMLESLEGYLVCRELLAQQLQLTLMAWDGGHQLHEIGHAAGEKRADNWLDLCHLRLEQVRLEKPVIAMQLSVERFKKTQRQSFDLFEDTHAAEEPLDLLSRLQVRLGPESVQLLGLQADHRPEHSWCYVPVDKTTASRLSAPQGRPSWLLKTPQRLSRMRLPEKIELLSGPERISSGWWDEQAVRRDYYIARWPDGRQGWVYRDESGSWYLHGWFG